MNTNQSSASISQSRNTSSHKAEMPSLRKRLGERAFAAVVKDKPHRPEAWDSSGRQVIAADGRQERNLSDRFVRDMNERVTGGMATAVDYDLNVYVRDRICAAVEENDLLAVCEPSWPIMEALEELYEAAV